MRRMSSGSTDAPSSSRAPAEASGAATRLPSPSGGPALSWLTLEVSSTDLAPPAARLTRLWRRSTAAGGEAVACYASVAEESGAASIIAAAMDSFGQIDVVVNNAGIASPLDWIENLTPADYRQMVEVHHLGTVYVTKAAWPHLVAGGYGRIVNTTSEGAARHGAQELELWIGQRGRAGIHESRRHRRQPLRHRGQCGRPACADPDVDCRHPRSCLRCCRPKPSAPPWRSMQPSSSRRRRCTWPTSPVRSTASS